jgi:hypothetical protein
MIFYVIVFFCFFHRVLVVFTPTLIIYIFRFFSLSFLKIIFILRDIQALRKML